MRKVRYGILFISLVLVFFIGSLYITGKMKYIDIKTTNLSNESINNIYLNESYNVKSAEEAFGKNTKRVNNTHYTDYEFASSSNSIAGLRVNNDKIIEISSQDFGNTFKTKKGITFNSSFEDIVKAYGNNFKKSVHKGEMGSPDYYDILYVDKTNKFLLQFEFTQDNGKDKLNFIKLSNY